MKLAQNQKTYVPAETDLKKKWFLVDVKDQTLGIIATKIARVLRGKDKLFFTPQHDCGDYVVVINAAQIRLAHNKMETKTYHWHTGYGAGLRTRTAREQMAIEPEKILYDAVWGMLPRNKLRRMMMKKLRIFPGAEHGHLPQAPAPQ